MTNYAPHVEQPVLMISGEWDNVFPPKTHQATLFEDFPNPQKKHEPVNRGHLILGDEVAPRMDRWLKKVFEPGASNDITELTPGGKEPRS